MACQARSRATPLIGWIPAVCGSATNASRSIEPDLTPESRPGGAMPRQGVGAVPTQEVMRDA
jgi:hypothetical protein